MLYESVDLFIDESSIKDLFLKKTKVNIYNIFIGLEDDVLTKSKFENIKVEFHMQYEKGYIFFTRYITYKTGRTIYSSIREMIKFLISWRVENFGHFLVCVK